MLIRRRVGDAVQLQQRRSSTNDPAAWELAQRGDALTRQADSLDAAGDAAGATQAYDEADSLLAVAQARDPKWDQPLVLRGRIAYDRSRRDGADATAAADWVARGLRLADAALTLDPQDPDALELRGTLRYWKWLVRLEPDEIAQGKLLADAQADLEAAKQDQPAPGGRLGGAQPPVQPDRSRRQSERPGDRRADRRPAMPTRPTPIFGTPMR